MRRDVTFESGGTRCAAWLYQPDGHNAPACVVLGHGFGCVKRLRLDAYAERFRAAGLAALVFDYRHFGESEGQPRQLVDIDRQLDDWRAAIAYARDLDGVDPKRIVLWGTSLSGGHVVVVAAEDDDIAAVVSQIPFTGGLAAASGPGLKQSLRLIVAGLRDELRGRRGRTPYYIPLYGPPGSLAALTAPGAFDRVREITDRPVVLDNRYTPRVMLRLGRYRPYRCLRSVSCPVLVCASEYNITTRTAPAIRAAQRASNATFLRYPVGPFEIYTGAVFEQVIEDQIAFLMRHFPVGNPRET